MHPLKTDCYTGADLKLKSPEKSSGLFNFIIFFLIA